jgi:hypothetical protein
VEEEVTVKDKKNTTKTNGNFNYISGANGNK